MRWAGSKQRHTLDTCSLPVKAVQRMGPNPFSRCFDHEVRKSRADCPVSKRRPGDIVGFLDYESLGRHEFFQYLRDPVAGKVIGPFQYPDEFNRDFAAYVAGTFGREGFQERAGSVRLATIRMNFAGRTTSVRQIPIRSARSIRLCTMRMLAASTITPSTLIAPCPCASASS